MTRHSIWTAFMALCVSITPIAVLAQSQVENPEDPYVHKTVGVEFPQQFENYIRGRVVEYDAEGNDASVGYHLNGMPSELTLYVYPSRGETCIGQFANANEAIVQRVGVNLSAQDPTLSFPAFADLEQYQARYVLTPNTYGFEHPEMISYLWIGCLPGDEWIVKYRGSFPIEHEEITETLTEDLFALIDWAPLIPSP